MNKRSLLGRLLDHLAFLFPSSEDATVYNLTVYLEDGGMFIVAADEWHWLPDRLMYPYGTPLFKARLRGDVVFTCRADLVKAVKATLREPQEAEKEVPSAD